MLRWVLLTDTGKRIPCDPHPTTDGTVCATRSGRGNWIGYVIRGDRPPIPGRALYMPHAATCADRPKPKPTPKPPEPLF